MSRILKSLKPRELRDFTSANGKNHPPREILPLQVSAHSPKLRYRKVMKSPSHLSIPFFAALSLAAFPTFSPAATSDPVGAMTVTLNEGADNFIAIPFTSAPSFQGSVASIANTAGDIYAVGLGADFAASASDGLAGLYYVRFLSGAAEGKYFTILNSALSSVSIDSLGDDLSGVQVGDSFAVFEYYTLSSLFPPATQTAILASTGNLTFQRGSEVLIPNVSGSGLNRAPNLKYYVTSTEWKNTADFSNADDVVLYPDSFIIVRQKSGAGSRDLVLFGSVPMHSNSTYVTQLTSANDNYLSYARPLDSTLADLDLGIEFLDSTGNLTFQRGDELLLWLSPTGLNPSPNKKFYRVGGQWRDTADFSVADSFVVKAGSALIIRKKAGVQQTLVWKEIPNY